MKPIIILISMSADSTLSSGDTLALDTITGSSSHGVTVSSGVITLPQGYQWSVQAQCVPTALASADLDWYVNSSASTTFQNTGISLLNSASNTSNLIGFIAVNSISASVDIELRSSASVTIDADFSCMILIGYPS